MLACGEQVSLISGNSLFNCEQRVKGSLSTAQHRVGLAAQRPRLGSYGFPRRQRGNVGCPDARTQVSRLTANKHSSFFAAPAHQPNGN